MPEEKNKIWTISRTKEALTVLCNRVEVLNLVYAEVDKYCHRKWSKTSAKIKFISNDQASDYMRSMHPGIFHDLFSSMTFALNCCKLLQVYNFIAKLISRLGIYNLLIFQDNVRDFQNIWTQTCQSQKRFLLLLEQYWM